MKWPRKVRTLFARLRTGHCKELADYRFIIDKEDDDSCERCDLERPETTEHILCVCPALDHERVRKIYGKVTIDMMVTNPEACRKILAKRFDGLRIEEPPEPPDSPSHVDGSR